jgi:hypothetical protein
VTVVSPGGPRFRPSLQRLCPSQGRTGGERESQVRSRRRWGRKAIGLIAAVSIITAGSFAGSSVAQNAAAPECPPAMPVDQVKAGMTGTGFTVTKGTTPEPFDVKVLGVLKDALLPGRDLIIVETSGPAIDAAGGVWFGMSGSPVYINNQLIGAVAWGLGFGPSNVIGLTPAADMYRILDYGQGGDPTGKRSMPSTVELSARERKEIAQRAGLEAADVAEFERLKVPLAISGVSGQRLEMVREAAERENLPFIPYSGGGSSSAAAPGPPLEPGGNFAAALSYGDVTAAGLGTTTAVCAGKALGMGHFFNFEGRTTMGASNADAITIWNDPLFGPFKVANIFGPLGTVDQDRFAGVRGILGTLPKIIPISSSVTATSTNNSRQGKTEGLLSEAIPFLTFIHMFQNIDAVFDEIGEGSSELTWTVRGTTESGAAWELNRSNMFVSDFDISFESLFELEGQLFTLFNNDFEEIEFTGVDVAATIHEEVRQYTIADVLVARNNGAFRDSKRLNVRSGDTVRLRVELEPYDGTATKTVDLAVKVPKKLSGRQILQVRGANLFGGELFCFFESDCADEYGNKIEDFDDLVEALENQSKNNQVRALILGRRKIVARDAAEMDLVVLGRKRVRLFVGG